MIRTIQFLILSWALFMPSLLAAEINPLGTFDFDLDRIGKNPEEQVEALTKMGFSGVTLRFDDGGRKVDERFNQFQKIVKAGDIKVYAAHFVLKLEPNGKLPIKRIKEAVKQAKSVDADFWLIILAQKNGVSRAEVLKAINQCADLCKKESVKCIIYPHDNTLIESTEEAVSLIEESQRKDLFVSFHLCHEIRAGNGYRLEEVAKIAKPYLRYASISGANREYEDNSQDWSKTIQPLDMGDYDLRKFVHAIRSIDYKGPIILHTFGLQKQKPDHHLRSMKEYRKLFDGL